jgi:hypothetical protein
MLFERRQMAGTNDVAGSNNPDPQFMIIFLHRVSNARLRWVDLGAGPRNARVNFDHLARPSFKIRLT